MRTYHVSDPAHLLCVRLAPKVYQFKQGLLQPQLILWELLGGRDLRKLVIVLDWGLLGLLNIGAGSWVATSLDRVHCARFVFFLVVFWLEIRFVVFPLLVEIT